MRRDIQNVVADMDIKELMRAMINFFDSVSVDLKEEYDELSQVDMELSDLDHYIEIHSLKAYEFAKVGKLRQELRRKRRDIKNNIEIIKVVKAFSDKYNNKLITGDIIQNLKEQDKLEKSQNNPSYTYRTDILERLKEVKK